MIFLSLRTGIIAVLILLAPTSLTVLGLKASTLDFISSNSFPKNPDSAFELYPSGRHIGVLPYYLDTSPEKFIVAASIISTVVSSAALAFALLAWPNGARVGECHLLPEASRKLTGLQTYRRPPHLFGPSLLGVSALLVTIAFIYLFAIRGRSAHFDPHYAMSDGTFGPYYLYDAGPFDLETWSCDLAAYLGAFHHFDLVAAPKVPSEHSMYRKRCLTERAGRWMLLTLLLVAWAAVLASWWALRGEKENIRRGIQAKTERKSHWEDGELDEFGVLR